MRQLLFLLLLSTSLSAQSVIPLYPEGIPCANDQEDTENFRKDIGRGLTGVHTPLLHHYAPQPMVATGASVMIIPGGGYTFNAWDHEGVDIGRYFLAEGVHVFLLQYRLPRHETGECKSHVALDDARRGVQTIRMMADSLGLDPAKVAVMGFSAGGHLSASAAIHFVDGDENADLPVERFSSRPDVSLPIYPVLIMEDSGAAHQGSIVSLLGEKPWDESLRKRYDLPGQVHEKVPPTFLVHAGDDRVVPVENSLRYYQALLAKGVPVDMHVYAQGGHGFASARQTELPVREWLGTVVDWLRGHAFVR
jgi:acetyl esterase/lipase